MPAIPTWLWITAGWALIALSASLFLRGRVFRSKLKKPHCPRCRYCVEGLNTLTCPECGRTAKNPREFLRVPRRKRWRIAALPICAAGWVLLRMPLALAHGWAGALPGWALANLAPLSDPRPVPMPAFSTPFAPTRPPTPNPFAPPAMPVPPGQSALTVRPARPTPPAPPAPKPLSYAALHEQVSSDLYQEAWRRLNEGDINNYAAAIYLRRYFHVPSKLPVSTDYLSLGWPWDAVPPLPPFLTAWADAQMRLSRVDVNIDVMPLKGPSTSMHMAVRATIKSHDYIFSGADFPVDARACRAEFMHPVSGPKMDNAVLLAMHPRIIVTPREVLIDKRRQTLTDQWVGMPAVGCAGVTLLLNGKPIAHGRWQPPFAHEDQADFARVGWNKDALELTRAHAEKIELEVIGEPTDGVALFMNGTIHQRQIWTGTARCRPEVVRQKQ